MAAAPGGLPAAGTERHKPLLSALAGISNLFDWSGRIIAAACIVALFFPLLVNVILRYATSEGLAWAYEIHALFLPWMVAGGIVIAAARGRNIAVTLLPDALSPAGRRVVVIVLNVLLAAIAIAVLKSSQPILKAAQLQTLSTLGIKQIWGYASIVYAFVGLGVIAIVDALRAAIGEDVLDSAPEHTSLS